MAPPQRSRKVSLSHVPSLLPALKAISALLKSSKTKGVVIGGAVATRRPQDIEDIRGIVSVNPKLDVRHIRAQVQDFAKIMEMQELWTDIAPLFPPTKKPRRSTRRKRSKQ